jgi:amino acid adenylation domain-containing protein
MNAAPANEKLVPDLVAAQAAQAPAAIACTAGGQLLLYDELDRRANQLANHLQSIGVGPEVVVGLCVRRSPAMAIGALGIMKAGGAYLPLDPSYPVVRRDFVLHDASARALVTEECFIGETDSRGCEVVAFDRDARLLEACSPTVPDRAADTSSRAYVIYTSGSTGEPKGVEITHASLLNLVYWHRRQFDVSAMDRATQLASPAFDAAIWELWPYLTAGASIHVVDDLTRSSPELLRDWLLAERITIGYVPTVLADALLATDWPPASSLRILLTGGDVLHRHPPTSIPFSLVNNYGPTEATVVATSGAVSVSYESESAPAIGTPISGVHIHVVDGELRAVPSGVTGEMLIGGAGLARGYLNRPELTAEKFIRDDICGKAGDRVYRTGDLVRSRPDGNLEFVGRLDSQVKVRGQRVELGEIESILNRHPSVASCAVVAQQLRPGELRLIAYVVPFGGVQSDDKPLRSHLSEWLPDYMIPGRFEWLSALPVTSNGKVDRTALSAAIVRTVVPPDAAVRPMNQIEDALVAMVAPLLRVDTVDITANFFTLGGHSLMAAQLIARIRDRFGVELPLRTVFDKPTIAQIAAEVELSLVAEIAAMSEEEAEMLASRPEPGAK